MTPEKDKERVRLFLRGGLSMVNVQVQRFISKQDDKVKEKGT